MYQKLKVGAGVLFILLAAACSGVASYQLAVRHMEELQTDYELRVSEQVKVGVAKQLEEQADELVEKLVQENSVSVSTNNDRDTLNVNTIYQIQKYDAVTGSTATDYETLPGKLVGCDRVETDGYFQGYMKTLPVEEFLAGLQSIGVVSFSEERLVVKKIYDSSKVKFRYYLIAVDGEVVVYYGDKATVYEYTGIEAENLSQEDQKALKNGIEVKDEEELFGILENYSS